MITGTGVHDRPESAFTIDWNECSRSAGTPTLPYAMPRNGNRWRPPAGTPSIGTETLLRRSWPPLSRQHSDPDICCPNSKRRSLSVGILPRTHLELRAPEWHPMFNADERVTSVPLDVPAQRPTVSIATRRYSSVEHLAYAEAGASTIKGPALPLLARAPSSPVGEDESASDGTDKAFFVLGRRKAEPILTRPESRVALMIAPSSDPGVRDNRPPNWSVRSGHIR
jgi:hypothetical protein